MKKIVDVVAVVKKDKDNKCSEYRLARSIRDGKVEKWWYEGGDGKRSINKILTYRKKSGRQDAGSDLPSVEDTLRSFNFRGFEFGNWLSQAERYDIFRAFQYCLADMSSWLGTNNIGFDNQIGVAFGARGARGAAAHYEPGENVINMTKMKGAGSFLHEYAHAIDYCVGAFFDQSGYYMSLSGGHSMMQTDKNVGGQFRAMMNKILLYVRSTESFKRMDENPFYDMTYWGNSTELFARLTEAYYAYYYNKNDNNYLVKRVSIYEKYSKEEGRYLSKAEMDVIKPEVDKFWKEVGLLLNNKCTLKATPFPKIETSNQHSATEIYKIVEETLFATDKKKLKSRFQNRYNLKTKITKGKGTTLVVVSDEPTKEIIFNDAERQEFSKLLSEALNKAGIKHTKTENGGNDGRKFYYRIDIENVFRSKAEPNVRLTFSFVDAEPKEEGKGKIKVMNLPKEFVVGRTYVSDYGKITDKKGHITVLERKGDMLKFKRLDGTGVFERKINESAGGSEYVADGHYQGSIKWSSNNELEYLKWLESLSKGKGNPKAEKGYKEMYGLTVNHTDKPYLTIESLKMGEDHMLRIYGVNQQKKNDSSFGGITSSSFQSRLTMSQYKDILAYANGYDKKSQKMLVDTLARLGWFKDSKMTPAEKKQAAADFIKETTGKKGKKPKADSSKKKVEKRPDKLNFDFGKFVADKTDPRDALKLTYEQYDYRVACNMFELVIEYLENELPEGYVRQYDKKNNLVYEGRLEKSPVCQAIYPNVNLALRVDPTKTAKLDIKQLTNSIEDLKKISKENKAKLKQFPKNAYVKSNEHQKAYNKSQWYDQAFFVIGGVCFRAKTISLMLYVCKMWNLNTLHIENERSGCIIKNEDESKIALFMPAPRYRNLIDEEEKMLKQKGYYVGVDYLTDHL